MTIQFKKLSLIFASPPLSPTHADTVFGHLCWAMRFVSGEDRLHSFLSDMKREQPPLLLSDMLPAGFLPRPRCIMKQKNKNIKRLRYIKTSDAFPFYDEKSVAEKADDKNYAPCLEYCTIQRTSMDRMEGHSLEGGLFRAATSYFPDGYDLYVKVADDVLWKEIIELFNFIKDHQGYGADKSCGYGRIASIKEDSIDVNVLKGLKYSTAKDLVALSGVVPVNLDLKKSQYKLRVKFGKLAEEYALEHPFKKPIAYLDLGSICALADPNKLAGSMVENVSEEYPEVVQYGYGMLMNISMGS